MNVTPLRTAVASLCLLGACASSTKAGPADAGSSGTTSGKKAIPADLRSFEANGEGMCEAPVTPDWKTAQDIYSQASGTWAKLKLILVADGANAATVANIDGLLTKYASDVSQKLVREAETDSNTINGAVPEFYDLYDSPVPSDALRLDAAFRFAEIQGEHSDWATASTALEKTKVVWSRLKPLVVAKAATRSDIPSAGTVVVDVDAAIAGIVSGIGAKSSPDTMKAAHRGLDLVDVLEQTFQ